MTSVTYKKQPAIHKTRGSVPVSGTVHPYTVGAVLWPVDVEGWIASRMVGKTLHVCCGKSKLGHVRVDFFEHDVDVVGDMTRLPFADLSFDTVLIDPPYSATFQVNHDMLNELHRVSRFRIIFQHWYLVANKNGQFKKANVFELSDLAYVPTVFGSGADKSRFSLAMLDQHTGKYYVVEEDLTDSKVFSLQELVAWQPRTYFGRAQLIQIYDKETNDKQIS